MNKKKLKQKAETVWDYNNRIEKAMYERSPLTQSLIKEFEEYVSTLTDEELFLIDDYLVKMHESAT